MDNDKEKRKLFFTFINYVCSIVLVYVTVASLQLCWSINKKIYRFVGLILMIIPLAIAFLYVHVIPYQNRKMCIVNALFDSVNGKEFPLLFSSCQWIPGKEFDANLLQQCNIAERITICIDGILWSVIDDFLPRHNWLKFIVGFIDWLIYFIIFIVTIPMYKRYSLFFSP